MFIILCTENLLNGDSKINVLVQFSVYKVQQIYIQLQNRKLHVEKKKFFKHKSKKLFFFLIEEVQSTDTCVPMPTIKVKSFKKRTDKKACIVLT